MSAITKEQLIEDLKASTQNFSGMFEIGEETICALMSLLTAPPAPVVVTDRSMFEKWWESEHGSPLDSWDSLRTPDGYCDDGIDGQFESWNACHAAMLQGADGKSPVIPDGWVIVPAEPTAEMLQSGISAHYERNQIQIHDRPAPGPMECAYVAMLAAAPQQEAE
ncbi:TPA: hypothetical protein RK230_003895 [Enterobacter asburiae]|nr:hypothetical protein [Enterobacter asburiae]